MSSAETASPASNDSADQRRAAAPRPVVVHIPRRFTKTEWGGTETVIYHLVAELNKIGYDSVIYTSDLLATPGADKVNGVRVRRFRGLYPRWGLSRAAKTQLDYRGGNYFSLSLFFALLFTRHLQAIHLHTGGFMGAMGRLVAKVRRVPYVISIHGGSLALPAEQMQKLLAPLKGSFNWGKVLEVLFPIKNVYRDATAILCLSEQERLLNAEKYPRSRVLSFPNGVDSERFAAADGAAFRAKYGIAVDAPVLLCVGSFYAQKNQQRLVEAFRLLHDSGHSRAQLVLIGVCYDRAYFDGLRAQVREYGLSDSVLFLQDLPYQSLDLLNAYAAADIFVFPSLYETFGIVVLEAWSAQTPVVCGRIGGIVDYGRDDDNLCFADVTSAVDIAAKTAALLADPAYAARIAAGGRKTVADYSWQAITRRLAALYDAGRR
ncbi:glycosyltransferase family 4 protein [Oligosphaera ethanolica]|uniref:Glycosyltransferase involved in cell wall biosynthesis n=1 Tax=Oligosphaera ethanolica TaxID=760260 RepID=A0AAE3VGV5_9BACT|nr:glycosyltransferase family 4 protein [Oligosphaera ethanolica]MDQ0290145.1 glycosyltransferase involved in cell wall biosynthesis [Oligosphaera ethanolica]